MADKEKEPIALGGTAIKPPGWDRTGFEAFRYMIWNPETGEVLTRTPISWLKIFVFYCIYYSCLAGFWVAALHIFFMTLPAVDDGPSWTLDKSLIGENPGVGLRPKNSDERIDSQMFVLKKGDQSMVPSHLQGEGDTNADYVRRLELYLETYNTDATGGYNNFDYKTELGKCGNSPFGYVEQVEKDEEGNVIKVTEEVAPCIMLKLNTIWDWNPKAMNSTDVTGDDEPLPPALKAKVEALEKNGGDVDMVWFNCEGRYPADSEALGKLEYFPEHQGIPIKYFPYRGRGLYENGKWERNYHSPLVAIKVSSPEVGQLVHIQCKAYYQGVIHRTKEKMGMVQFEVQVRTNI